ncbi:MAG: C39 family peptidase [Candidatus Binatia bacterium]
MIAVCALPLPAWSASFDIGQGNRVFVPLTSLKGLRDQNVVKQTYDYSCGAGALATLLTYGLGDKATELEILQSVLVALSKEEESLREKEGLSLLDLQRVAQARGHKAQGFRLTAEYLSKLQGPVIVFIKPRGYEHFAVLKGVRDDRAYLADPSLGNVRMPLYKFLSMWLDDKSQGVIFVVERKEGEGPNNSFLKAPIEGLVQPEILTARQMLEVGNPYVRFPELFR